MPIVTRAVIRLASIRRRLDFGGESLRPFFPREITLFGKFDRERERLRFPRLCKGSVRLVQDSPPTNPHRQSLALPPAFPTNRAPKNVRNRDAADSLPENAHSYPGTQRLRDLE